MTPTRTCTAALVLLAAVAGAATAQLPATPPPAQVLVLGTYHFANPGLDVVKTEVADVLAPARQAEIEAIVEALARFRPTRVAVEAVPEHAARWDSLYAAFRAGRHSLRRNESEQLGLRLAARLDHPRVYPIDHPGEFPFGRVMEYAQRHDTASARAITQAIAQITAEENRRQREMGVIENLRVRNLPERIVRDHGFYMRLAAVGAGDGYAGADLVARWYERNLRIFANLQRITRPGDRVLVIIGSGHLAILRELIRHTPGMTLVEAVDYLPAR